MKLIKFILMFILCSCYGKNNEDDHEQVADRVAAEFSQTYPRDQGYTVFGYGGGMMNRINNYYITYRSVENVNIDEARKKIVNLTEHFLEFVNKSDAAKFFAKYPYDENSLDLSIGFYSPSNTCVDENYIARVNVYDGYIRYSICKSESFHLIFREPYSQAYEKVTGKPFSERKLPNILEGT